MLAESEATKKVESAKEIYTDLELMYLQIAAHWTWH
jgi:hypothetical protein